MFYIEAPRRVPDEPRFRVPRIFMAGGITECPDWQKELRERLVNIDAVLINPRRANFPIHDPDAAAAQIEWEHQNLAASDAILFWFPAETLCPIVLFELGAWSHWRKRVNVPSYPHFKMESKPLFVATHSDYKRRQDVEIQLKLERPDIDVLDTLEGLAQQVETWCEAQGEKRRW